MAYSDGRENSAGWQKDVNFAIKDETRRIMQDYAGVSSDKLVEHVEKTRNRAWDVNPYPSIGGLTWLLPYIVLHQAHETILQKVKNGASIVDCGCFISPDLRQLAYEGAPTDKMYGFDIVPEFFDIGYDFYNDRDRFHGSFIGADVRQDSSALQALDGKMDIVWCPKFLHLWEAQDQIEVAARLVKLLKPVPGSLFVGQQNGYPDPDNIPYKSHTFASGRGIKIRLHNVDTIKEMWNEVAARTGTTWNVEARLLDLRTIGLHKDDGSDYGKSVGYNLQWTAALLEPPRG